MIYLAHHLLTESAHRGPDRIAVSFRDQRLTYRELDAETNRLAHVLRAQGVRPGDRVGIYLHKSVASVVSIFGILKAGGVYVPLDPNSPARRVAYIIGNCRIRCLVTAAAKVTALAEAAEVALDAAVVVEPEAPAAPVRGVARVLPWSVVTAADASAPAPAPVVDTDLAYILYTSGSTGDPKGVMLTHRHALTFIDWAAGAFGIGPDDRLSNHAPLHFDLSILDIFCAIKAGAAVVPVPEGLATFPVRLAEFIEREGITVWYSVPSALILLLLHGQLRRFRFPSLRTVLFAGEVFPVKHLRALMDAVPHPAYYNLYGPTETNVCTFYRVPALPAERTQPIPIGRACANCEVFALDDGGAPVGPGGEGELYVRGSLVTRGYWGDPARTARAVVRNPLQPAFDELVYRTGDIVTLDAQGDYLLVGRRDHMIKSRGYRIELGEIEAALYAHPSVKEGVVIPVPDEVLGARLRALVVTEGPAASADEIKRHCAERVPVYMVPESVEFREALPKTSTGKIDRTGLARELAAAVTSPA